MKRGSDEWCGYGSPESVDAVVVYEWRGRGEVAEEGEDVAFSDAHVPKLPADLGRALLLLADL